MSLTQDEFSGNQSWHELLNSSRYVKYVSWKSVRFYQTFYGVDGPSVIHTIHATGLLMPEIIVFDVIVYDSVLYELGRDCVYGAVYNLCVHVVKTLGSDDYKKISELHRIKIPVKEPFYWYYRNKKWLLWSSCNP